MPNPSPLKMRQPFVEIEARISTLKSPFGLHDMRLTSSGPERVSFGVKMGVTNTFVVAMEEDPFSQPANLSAPSSLHGGNNLVTLCALDWHQTCRGKPRECFIQGACKRRGCEREQTDLKKNWPRGSWWRQCTVVILVIIACASRVITTQAGPHYVWSLLLRPMDFSSQLTLYLALKAILIHDHAVNSDMKMSEPLLEHMANLNITKWCLLAQEINILCHILFHTAHSCPL